MKSTRQRSNYPEKKQRAGVDPRSNLRRLKSVVVERIHGWIQGEEFKSSKSQAALAGLSDIRKIVTEAFFLAAPETSPGKNDRKS